MKKMLYLIFRTKYTLSSFKKREELLGLINSYSTKNGSSDVINFYLRIKVEDDGKFILKKRFFRYLSRLYWFQGNMVAYEYGTKIFLNFKLPLFTIVILFTPILYTLFGVIYFIDAHWSINELIAALMPLIFIVPGILFIAYDKLRIKQLFVELLELKEQ